MVDYLRSWSVNWDNYFSSEFGNSSWYISDINRRLTPHLKNFISLLQCAPPNGLDFNDTHVKRFFVSLQKALDILPNLLTKYPLYPDTGLELIDVYYICLHCFDLFTLKLKDDPYIEIDYQRKKYYDCLRYWGVYPNEVEIVVPEEVNKTLDEHTALTMNEEQRNEIGGVSNAGESEKEDKKDENEIDEDLVKEEKRFEKREELQGEGCDVTSIKVNIDEGKEQESVEQIVRGMKEYIEANPALTSISSMTIIHSEVDDAEVADKFYEAIATDSSSSEDENDDSETKPEKEKKIKLKNISWAIASFTQMRATTADSNGELNSNVPPMNLDAIQLQGLMREAKDEADGYSIYLKGVKDINNQGKEAMYDLEDKINQVVFSELFGGQFMFLDAEEYEKLHRSLVRDEVFPLEEIEIVLEAERKLLGNCVENATLLAKIGANAIVVAARLLHDSVEDFSVTYDHISESLGAGVADLVEGVSKLSHLSQLARENNTAGKTVEEDRCYTMFLAMADARDVLIQLPDRMHDIMILDVLPLIEQQRFAKETLEIFAQLANRLGISTGKEQLENIYPKNLKPDQYRTLSSKLVDSSDDGSVTSSVERLEQALKDGAVSLPCMLGRYKSLYNIYSKMLKNKLNMDEVHEIHGLRLIVESKQDYYKALGVVQQIWRKVPG